MNNTKRIYGITAEGKRVMKDEMFKLMKNHPDYIIGMEIVQSITAKEILDNFPDLSDKQKELLKNKNSPLLRGYFFKILFLLLPYNLNVHTFEAFLLLYH